MDYARVYQSFIEDRRSREGSLEAFDRHHVVPRCLGGGDEPENIIRLSYADHLFAHVLLAKIHGGVLATVAARMSGMRKYNGGRRSRAGYQAARLAHREMMLDTWRDPAGREKLMAGRPPQRPSAATNAKRSASLRGRKKSEDHIRNLSKSAAGRVPSPETREKLRVAMAGNQNARGSKMSPEHLEKLRRINKERHARNRELRS